MFLSTLSASNLLFLAILQILLEPWAIQVLCTLFCSQGWNWCQLCNPWDFLPLISLYLFVHLSTWRLRLESHSFGLSSCCSCCWSHWQSWFWPEDWYDPLQELAGTIHPHSKKRQNYLVRVLSREKNVGTSHCWQSLSFCLLSQVLAQMAFLLESLLYLWETGGYFALIL